MKITIRKVKKADFESWKVLFTDYADFYKIDPSDEVVQTVWEWFHNDMYVMQADVAVDENGELIGLIQYNPMPRTLGGNMICYLSDLFVAESYRKKGVAEQLMQHLVEECKKNGWGKLRLLTNGSNYAAQKVYDKIMRKTDFILYDMDVK